MDGPSSILGKTCSMTAIDDKCRECGQRFSLIDGMVTSCLIDKALTKNVVKGHRFFLMGNFMCLYHQHCSLDIGIAYMSLTLTKRIN